MKKRRTVLALHGVLLLAQVWLLRDIAVAYSPTVDEMSHLVIGVMTLASGDVRFCHDDPPLQNYVNGAPVLLVHDCTLPFDSDAWRDATHLSAIARTFFEANRERFLDMFSTARWGTIFLSAVLACLVFWWTRSRFGDIPALAAQAVLTFEPNLLAHGCLVTTDLAAVVTFLVAAMAFDAFVQRPSGRRLLGAGAALGAAWLAKHAAITLLPVFWILARTAPSVRRWIAPNTEDVDQGILALPRKLEWRWFRVELRCIALLALVLAIAFAVIWAGYGFEIGDSRTHRSQADARYVTKALRDAAILLTSLTSSGTLTLQDVEGYQRRISGVVRKYLPAFTHIDGFFKQRNHAQQGHYSYFRGRAGYTGWWDYYPTLFFVKQTVPFLILVGIGATAVFTRRTLRDPRRWVLVVAPFVYMLVLCTMNAANIGYRHALPATPFWLIWIALGVRERILPGMHTLPRLWVRLWRAPRRIGGISSRLRFALLVALIGAHVMSVLRIHPYEIAYYNELAGGPDAALAWAADSNADWGQALPDLERFCREKDLDEIRLLYFGPPELVDMYDIPAVRPTAATIWEPGYVAVSATTLTGVGRMIDTATLSKLRRMEPVERLGYAIHIYEMPAAAPGAEE